MRKLCFKTFSLASTIIFLICFSAWAIPRLINYQGNLKNADGISLNGTYTMTFSLYNVASDGDAIWSESQSVTVIDGIYNLELGSKNPLSADLFESDNLYLEVEIESEVLTPRQKITFTAYAMKAEIAGDSDTVDGINASYLPSSHTLLALDSYAQFPNSVLKMGEANEINADMVDGKHYSDIANKLSEDIIAHSSIFDAHHTKTTSFSELTDHATNDQIPDDITINYALSAGDSDTVDGKHASEFLQSVAMIAELRILPAGVYPYIIVQGYYTPGDGGGGNFYWDNIATEPDNKGTIIVPNSNPPIGRWKRVIDGSLSVKYFGAKGDESTDDTAAIQAALNAAKLTDGGSIFIPQGTYLVSSELSVDSCVKIFGSGWNAIIMANNANFDVFRLTSCATGSRLTGFQIQGAATSDTTLQFAIFTDVSSIPTNVIIDHLLISGPNVTTGCNNGIKLTTGANDWTISHNQFKRLIGTTSGHGYGVLLGAAHRNIITHNHFLGGIDQGRHAVYLGAGASYNIVSQNVVKDFHEGAFPISTYTWQPVSQYNHIINNIIINCGQLTNDSGAIGVYGKSSYNHIAGNIIIGYKGEGIIITDSGSGGLCIGNEVVDNSIYKVSRFGIVVMGAKNTDVRSNKVFDASQLSPGTYEGINVRSEGTFGREVCEGTKIVGNTSWGSSQRAAFGINSASPVPTNTVVIGNVFLAGIVAGKAYQLNNISCTFVDNASDQNRLSGEESDGIDFHLSCSTNLDFPSIDAGTTAELTVSLVGVQTTGWTVTATPQGGLETGLVWSTYVISSDTIAIRVANITTGSINPAVQTFRVQAWKY